MKKELAINLIYNDFINKVKLTDKELEVLNLYIKDNTIIKIADETKQGTATVSRIISDLKDKYNNYKKLEISKLLILQNNKK